MPREQGALGVQPGVQEAGEEAQEARRDPQSGHALQLWAIEWTTR